MKMMRRRGSNLLPLILLLALIQAACRLDVVIFPTGGITPIATTSGLTADQIDQTATAVTQPAKGEPVSPASGGLTADQVALTATAEAQSARGNPWVFIPGGKFLMGSLDTDPGANQNEKPQHYVVLNGFFIMRNEVTNGDYATCVKAGTCGEPASGDTGPLSHYKDSKFSEYPVVGISWKQAVDFCTFIQGRLPTEAEWEKAARGKEDLLFPWGDKPATCDLLNIKNCKNDVVQVSSYAGGVSPYKIADISGNVAEWVADWYDPNFYVKSPLVSFSPIGPTTGTERVVRGGSWMEDAVFARTAARTKLTPDQSGPDTGFRCVAGTVMAPMCSSGSYRNFCEDPNNPPPKDCVPGQPPVLCGFEASGTVTCDGKNDNITIQTSGTSSTGFIGTLPGFTCTTSAGKIICTGPKQDPGTAINVNVCSFPLARAVYVPKLYDVLLAAYDSPLMKTASNVMSCAPGYKANCSTNPCTCVPDPDFKWPEGFLVPDGNCPQGYLLNKAIGCCVPGTVNPCPKGEYTSTGLQSNCTPVDPYGCVAPQVPDGMGHCINDPNYQAPTTPGECPPGFIPTQYGCEDKDVVALSLNCLADDTGYNGQCNPQPNTNTCAKGYVNTPDGCKPGYGPGSSCPNGYMLLPGSLCCTPIPGNGSHCPNDVDSATAYDPGSDTCLDGTQQQMYKGCKDFPGTFWNEDLKMCLPLGSDCCPAGYDWLTDAKQCMPIVFGDGKMTEKDCGAAYTLVSGFCVLKQTGIGTQSQECCKDVNLKAPCCYSSCISGYTLNPSTHCCDKAVNPCAGAVCPGKPPCGRCCHEVTGGCARN